MGDYTGIYVSVNCGEMGTFQGQISVIDSCGQRMILEKAFHNGRPYLSRQVTIEVDDIKSLEMIDAYNDPSQPSVNNSSNNNNNNNNSNNHNIAKPVATKPTNACDMQKCCKESNIRECPKKNFENKPSFHNENVKPLNKKEKYKQKWISRDEAAFGSPIDQHMLADFDFEKNLALFNKKAFYEELNASKPDVKKTDKKGGKFRWDENILSSKPAAFRQLLVPKSDSIEYVTDSGLIVPSLTPEVRKQLFRVAERHGLTFERQSEIIGRACTEMALHLLGGAHRLNPQNQHQCPSVVVLCGSHRNGSLGISSARQLASHGVRTIVLLHDSGVLTTEMTHELELYRMTCNKLTINIQDLYAAPVDLIIVALSDSKFSDRVSPLARWVNENRAQVLALDPPQRGIPGINIKCSLIPGLPLAYDSCNGKIYLCNLGIPVQVFKAVGIKYVPPFGPKFFMPLYPNNI